MTGELLRRKRVEAGIVGRLLCRRTNMDRSKLSDIERGYVRPSPAEFARLEQALNELIDAKQKVANFAAEVGWPLPPAA